MADEPTKTGQNDNLNDTAPKPANDTAPVGEAREAEPAAGPTAEFDLDVDFETDDGPFDLAAMLKAQVEEMELQQADLAMRLAKAQEDIHRHQAEIQNLHRRREKETEDASKYAIAKFANDIVGVSDNFERAIASVPAESTHDNPVLKSLLDGVTMTEREFLHVLERHGVKRIMPKDEMFDPHRHQAVMEKDDKAVPSGLILQVFQPGYIIADRVLRPAMVVVARGGPKPVKAQPAAEAKSAIPEAGQPADGVETPDDAGPATGTENT